MGRKPIVGEVSESRLVWIIAGKIGWAEEHRLPVVATILEPLSPETSSDIRDGLHHQLYSTNSRYGYDTLVGIKDTPRIAAFLHCDGQYAGELMAQYIAELQSRRIPVAGYAIEYQSGLQTKSAPSSERSWYQHARASVDAFFGRGNLPVLNASEENHQRAEVLYHDLTQGLERCKSRMDVLAADTPSAYAQEHARNQRQLESVRSRPKAHEISDLLLLHT